MAREFHDFDQLIGALWGERTFQVLVPGARLASHTGSSAAACAASATTAIAAARPTTAGETSLGIRRNTRSDRRAGICRRGTRRTVPRCYAWPRRARKCLYVTPRGGRCARSLASGRRSPAMVRGLAGGTLDVSVPLPPWCDSPCRVAPAGSPIRRTLCARVTAATLGYGFPRRASRARAPPSQSRPPPRAVARCHAGEHRKRRALVT